MDAVGNSDAVKGDPGQEEPGVLGQPAPDRLNAVEMAKDVLGHGTGMAGDPQQERVTVHSDQASQFASDQFAER